MLIRFILPIIECSDTAQEHGCIYWKDGEGYGRVWEGRCSMQGRYLNSWGKSRTHVFNVGLLVLRVLYFHLKPWEKEKGCFRCLKNSIWISWSSQSSLKSCLTARKRIRRSVIARALPRALIARVMVVLTTNDGRLRSDVSPFSRWRGHCFAKREPV